MRRPLDVDSGGHHEVLVTGALQAKPVNPRPRARFARVFSVQGRDPHIHVRRRRGFIGVHVPKQARPSPHMLSLRPTPTRVEGVHVRRPFPGVEDCGSVGGFLTVKGPTALERPATSIQGRTAPCPFGSKQVNALPIHIRGAAVDLLKGGVPAKAFLSKQPRGHPHLSFVRTPLVPKGGHHPVHVGGIRETVAVVVHATLKVNAVQSSLPQGALFAPHRTARGLNAPMAVQAQARKGIARMQR